MSCTDVWLWPDAAYEEEVFLSKVGDAEWDYKRCTGGFMLVVEGKLYDSYQSYLVLNHRYSPRPEAFRPNKRVSKKRD